MVSTCLLYTSSEELATLTASLKDSCDAGIIAFIRGTKELNEDNWKAFLDEMDAAGYTRMEELQLDVYKRQVLPSDLLLSDISGEQDTDSIY